MSRHHTEDLAASSEIQALVEIVVFFAVPTTNYFEQQSPKFLIRLLHLFDTFILLLLLLLQL